MRHEWDAWAEEWEQGCPPTCEATPVKEVDDGFPATLHYIQVQFGSFDQEDRPGPAPRIVNLPSGGAISNDLPTVLTTARTIQYADPSSFFSYSAPPTPVTRRDVLEEKKKRNQLTGERHKQYLRDLRSSYSRVQATKWKQR